MSAPGDWSSFSTSEELRILLLRRATQYILLNMPATPRKRKEGAKAAEPSKPIRKGMAGPKERGANKRQNKEKG
jgi:hypothetical protein